MEKDGENYYNRLMNKTDDLGLQTILYYSTASVGRRRLRGKLFIDSELRDLLRRIEEGCQE